MGENKNPVDSSFWNASLPVELLTTSAAEVFDGFFAPALPVLCWLGLQLPKPMNPLKLESAPKSSKTFWQLVNSSHIGNLSQSLQCYASSRSFKYNSEYIHLSQICASLHMTRCTPGVMSITSLTCNGTSPKIGLLAAWPPVAEAASAMGCGIVGIKYVAILVSGILGHYLHVSSLSVLHSNMVHNRPKNTSRTSVWCRRHGDGLIY